MIELQGEPLVCEDGGDLVSVRLSLVGMPQVGVVALGIRDRHREEIAQGLAILPGPSVHFDLDDDLFEQAERVELAVKVNGSSTPSAPVWEKMDWSWTGEFQARIEGGKRRLIHSEA